MKKIKLFSQVTLLNLWTDYFKSEQGLGYMVCV